MGLQTKLLLSKVVLAIVPAAVIAAILLWQTNNAFRETASQTEHALQQGSAGAREALVDAGMTDLTHVAENVRDMCQAQHELLQQKVNHDLNVAQLVLSSTGEIHFAEETLDWRAVNQYTNEAADVSLPKMGLGDTWLTPNTDISTPSPVVDDVQRLVGGTCTVFQRMNSAGDILRVCTNVPKTDNTRAIGTYIPAVNPDGTPNPVVAALQRGETFRGRAYVVNQWYITAYRPILSDGEWVGALYVGVPEQILAALREAIMSIKVGKSGYVYVLNARGDTRGYYVISKDGARDGEDISGAKDANGNLFIQEICDTALALKEGGIGDARYAWKNAGDTVSRDKVVKVAYFAPWDWVIGVGAYEDEFFEAATQMEKQTAEALAAGRQTQDAATATALTWCAGAGGVLLVLAIAMALFVARGVARPITRLIKGLNEGADQVNEAASQVASAAQQLAEGASEQASSLEKASNALEEMATMTRNNAEHARQASGLATKARTGANTGDHTVVQLNEAMAAINDSSGQISRIIKVIEEIAFQTNLLALNAAVEAARAGEHGKGFAVVADEVRNLAQRAASASGDVTGLIENSVERARDGARVAADVGSVLGTVVTDITGVADLLEGITRASEEQAQGVDEINTAVSQVDRVTQQNAAGAEESASAAEELAAQAQTMRSMVGRMVGVVSGRRSGSASPASAEPAGGFPGAE
ncbi:MAG: methyl-accepting chemotaxis protein [Phycisphaerae bacterium]|jgi:methyl-accepting chemotaxis protein